MEARAMFVLEEEYVYSIVYSIAVLRPLKVQKMLTVVSMPNRHTRIIRVELRRDRS